MRTSIKPSLITVLAILVFLGVLAFGVVKWYNGQEKKYSQVMVRILRSVSLPDTATFKDYAKVLRREIKPGFTVREVHAVMRGYDRIETFPFWETKFPSWKYFLEYYRYDFPWIDEFFPGPTAIIIEYDSSWNFKSFATQP